MAKKAKQAELEAAKEEKRAFEAERLRKYREDLARQNAKAEAEGGYEEVFVEEFECQPCKKKFKKEGQL